MRHLLLFSLLLLAATAASQSRLAGHVYDQDGQPLPGANVYLVDTYDGASSDLDGAFTFTTEETGTYTLRVSAVGFEPRTLPLHLPLDTTFRVTLKEAFGNLEGVTVTAQPKAAGEAQTFRLKPLDIVTTAGTPGDIVGALSTLPGVQRVGESGRLFVRGGDDAEARTFVDGLWVQNPYQASVPNVPTRGRFSPFMFKGTTFSTGAYSAEYGQALSAVLDLSTTDMPTADRTDLSLMSVGASAAHTWAGQQQAFTGEAGYVDLTPYFAAVPQEQRWERAPRVWNGSAVYRRQLTEHGLLKAYAAYSQGQMDMFRPDAATLTRPEYVAIDNRFAYANASYRDLIGERWTYFAGASYSHNRDVLTLAGQSLDQTERSVHLKNTWSYDWSRYVSLQFGGEGFRQQTRLARADSAQHVGQTIGGAFAEADLYLTRKLTARAGLRYDGTAAQASVAPRLSVAYKLADRTLLTAAYGQFVQPPRAGWLAVAPALDFERATHYQLNFQRERSGRTLRAEAYRKQYRDLVRFENITDYRNDGTGYAQGLDMFYRDRTSVDNLDFWVSYGWLDTRRRYRDFPTEAVPTFAAAHSAAVVGKYFWADLKTQFGASFTFTGPRPYHDPNGDGFNAGRTAPTYDLSLNASYLYREHVIFHASVSNALGVHQVHGYRYATQPTADGTLRREAIRPGAPRFLFVGVFITLTQDQTQNQLDNL